MVTFEMDQEGYVDQNWQEWKQKIKHFQGERKVKANALNREWSPLTRAQNVGVSCVGRWERGWASENEGFGLHYRKVHLCRAVEEE